MKVQGQAAIVTGGGGGLGKATAKALVDAGAKVTLLDNRPDMTEAAAKDMGALGIVCDVTDAEQTARALEQAKAAHGVARILVNCVGIAPAKKIVGKHGPMALEDFAKVVTINLVGSFNTLRLFAADLLGAEPLEDGERGVAINTSSVAATEGQIGQAAYSASKGGIVGMTLPAAREFAPAGIRVNAIAPGLFGTPLLLDMPQEVQDSLAATVPFPSRFGHPEEFAALAMHIVENVMINGETIRLDGALRMQAK